MATNRISIDAPVGLVFSVLTDPASYPLWVVGTKRIRDADPTWPTPGSSFRHAVGWGPLEQRDSTSVVAIDPPHLLVLEVRVRPLVGVARVEITLEERGDSTELELTERPVRGPIRQLELVTETLIAPRNWLSLRRLKFWCEQRRLALPATID